MDDLLKALQAAAAIFASDEKASAPEAEKPWMTRPLPRSIIEPVMSALKGVPDVLALTRQKQVSLASSTVQPLHTSLLASDLVKRTHALGDAARAVRDLQDLVSTNAGRARIVMVLAGIRTAGRVDLAPGVCLVPFADLKLPSWIEDFREKKLWPLSRTFESVAPSAALVTRIQFKPLFTTEEQVECKFPEATVAQLRTIAHCIALAAKHSAAIFKVVVEDDDPRFPLASSGILFADPRWGSSAAEPYDIDPEQVRAIFANYQTFRGDRRSIDTAMLRLAEAQGGGRWREDRAIDLGIALEAVLMHTPKGNRDDKDQISYKIGLRASWLIGQNLADRQEVFRKVRRLYRFRSQAAHSGSVKTKPDAWPAVDAEIDAGIALAGQIVLAVLANGEWRDWDNLMPGGH